MTVRSVDETAESVPSTPSGVPPSAGEWSPKAQAGGKSEGAARGDARIREALDLANQGDEVGAYSILKGIFEPLIDVPQAFQTWMRLAGREEPERAGLLKNRVESWIRAAQSALNEKELADSSEEGPESMVSRTLAELFWRQGHRDKAEAMYRVLLGRDPGDAALLREFRERFRDAGGEMSPSRMLRTLEEWAQRIQRRRRRG